MIDIGTSSHHHYFVVRKEGDSIVVLVHGNPNKGLSYHVRWIDLDNVVMCDTRGEADEHRKRFVAELRSAGYARKCWSGWKTVRGDLILRLKMPDIP